LRTRTGCTRWDIVALSPGGGLRSSEKEVETQPRLTTATAIGDTQRKPRDRVFFLKIGTLNTILAGPEGWVKDSQPFVAV